MVVIGSLQSIQKFFCSASTKITGLKSRVGHRRTFAVSLDHCEQ